MDLSKTIAEAPQNTHRLGHRGVDLSSMGNVEAQRRLWELVKVGLKFIGRAARRLAGFNVLEAKARPKWPPNAGVLHRIGMYDDVQTHVRDDLQLNNNVVLVVKVSRRVKTDIIVSALQL